MKKFVFIFYILAIVSIAKATDFRKLPMADRSEKFQQQTHVLAVSDTDLIFEISADDANGLTEERINSHEAVTSDIFVFPAFIEKGKIQNKLQPFIFDLPPPNKA